MSFWPQWDAKVQWPNSLANYAIDGATGREAYYGPFGEPGTPSTAAADAAWGTGNYSWWVQPDGRDVYYLSAYGFGESLLAALGAPIFADGLTAISLWANSEGMPANSYNPLATMYGGLGEHFQSPYTAPFYPNPYLGLYATWATLQESSYESLVAFFKEQSQLATLFAGINDSPWCRGCQNGHYPIDLYDALPTTTKAPPVTTTGGGGGTVVATGTDAAVPADVSAAWDQVKTVVNTDLPTGAYYLGILNATKL